MAGEESEKSASDILRESLSAGSMAAAEAREEARQAPQPSGCVSKEEFARWLRPNDALVRIMERNGWAREQAVHTIISRLSADLITAVAEHALLKNRSGKEDRQKLYRVPAAHWNADSQWLPNAYFWETGDIYFDLSETVGYSVKLSGRVSYFGVRFDPVGIEAICIRPAPHPRRISAGKEEPELAPVIALPNKGGRPPKEFWEPLLIEMFDQLWHGTLVPKRQSDIENAMHDWLSGNGHSASEKSVRQRAQSLWKVWTKEGIN